MLVLGIETSCDETACAVVQNGRRVLSNVIFSQVTIHQKTGGVVPEVAAREHAVKIIPVLEEALKKAKISLTDIDAIAVTKGPGLQTSLLTGVNCANTLALLLKIPLIPVNHIEGHIYANFLQTSARWWKLPKFPIVVLTASGGHNELILWKNHGVYQFLGSTLDDAAGEAFDKVARLLGLPYPGGPHIEKLAKKGNPNIFPLPLPYPKTFDFSFSGIKTAVLYLIRDLTKGNKRPLTTRERINIAASFQKVICEVLIAKFLKAAEKFGVHEIHLAGGVSANRYLQRRVQHALQKPNRFRFPPLPLCTDNAAMIATAGFYKLKKHPMKYKKWQPVISDPNLKIRNW